MSLFDLASGGLHDELGAELDALGGILRCKQCKCERPMRSASVYLQTGWPECCGYTMTWLTADQLKREG